MWNEIGNSISLENFPLRTNPFWNMKRNNKTGFLTRLMSFYMDSRLSDQLKEAVEKMREMFYTIEDGKYSQKLF